MTPDELRKLTHGWRWGVVSVEVQTLYDVADELERLQRENAELTRDIGRYRWLRENMRPEYGNGQRHTLFLPAGSYIGPFDAVVDAAIGAALASENGGAE